MLLTYILRYLFHCFPDDLEFSYDGTGRLVIGMECIQIHSGDEALDTLYGCQNVLQVKGMVPHTVTT